MNVPDHGERTAIENLCLELRVGLAGRDYLDEPCICSIIRAGYDLARHELQRNAHALEQACTSLACYTFRGKDTSIGEEADRLVDEMLELGAARARHEARASQKMGG